VLLACQQPTAPEADEKLDQAVPSALGNDQAPPEQEEHQGC
jgi:hypothetical protein